MNLSFSGCGFLGIYHVGVASAIKEYASDLAVERITGASAGGLAAACLLCDCCLGQCTSDILKTVIQARSRALGPLHPSFSIVRIMREGLQKLLPPNAHRLCSGKLFLSLTRLTDGTNHLVSQYDSKEDLIQALICSAFIPFYCGTVPPTYKGVRYIDGGWSDNLPVLDAQTVTVSPFSGESDICPSDSDSASFFGCWLQNTSIRFTARNLYRLAIALFPPHPEVLSQMCRQGFEDALRFLVKYDLIACTRCIAVRSCITLPAETLSRMNSEHPSEAPSRAPPALHRARTTSKLSAPNFDQHNARHRQRLLSASESECEHCRDVSHRAPRKGLPKLVKKSLATAEAQENSLFGYLMRTRAMKMIRYLTIPCLLPWDLTYTACIRLLEWLPSLPSDMTWFLRTSTETAKLLLQEIENHRQNYSARFTCQLAITDVNYHRPPTNDEHVAMMRSRRNSGHSQSSLAIALKDCPFTETKNEMNIGFSMNVNAQSSQVRCLTDILDKDSNTELNNVTASEMAKAAGALEQYGLQAPVVDHPDEEASTTDTDQFASILEFTRHREALMVYYYTDNTSGQVNVTEIFGVEEDSNVVPRASRRNSLHEGVREEEEPVVSRSSRASSFRERKQCHNHSRCVPKRNMASVWQRPTSSDSEGDSERLWVPRQSSHSNEHDYEPEDESEDHD